MKCLWTEILSPLLGASLLAVGALALALTVAL